MEKNNLIWKGKKHIWCGLPLTFTTYLLYDCKLIIDTGFLNKKEDEVRLYRILDISLTKNLIQRIFGLGSIKCCSADRTLGDFTIKNIKNSEEVKNNLSNMIEEQRKKNRVSSREFIADMDDEI